MTSFDTLTSALLGQADPATGICFIDDDNSTDVVSYPELTRLAQGYLAVLQERGVRQGDELVIAFHSVKNYVISYWAALLGGIVPVPLTAPKTEAEVRKVLTVWNVLRSPWIALDDPGVADRLRDFRGTADQQATVEAVLDRHLVSVECAAEHVDADPVLADVTPDDIAFIQFSSGSTGDPKGVTLTHRNLLCNAADLIEALNVTAEDVFLSWKPISHDFGMIAFHLTPLVAGCAQYRMTPKHFIWNATDWMSAAHTYRATILGTPNFGVQHFLNRYDQGRAEREAWDLTCVRSIVNGAEMINARLCRDFVETMRGYGLRDDVFAPGYGLAENTLVVSICHEDDPVRTIAVDRGHLDIGDTARPLPAGHDDAVEYVLCGSTSRHSTVAIVDDEGRELDEDTVGHIHVKGDCVTSGYYRNEAASAEILRDGGWMNTQDVGFVHDGHVVIVGRRKDVIIIGGVNHYPTDIESVILEDLGRRKLNQFIACAVPNTDTGSDDLVVFAYFKGRAEKFTSVEAAVTRAVMTRLGLKVAAVVPIRTVPKTTSGKVQRYRLVSDYLAERRPPASTVTAPHDDERVGAGAAAARRDLVDGVVAVVDDFVTVSADDYSTSLFELGCTSIQLISLQEELQQRLGVDLESTFIIDHPTVHALVDEITRRLEQTRPTPSAPPRPESATESATGSAHASEPIAVIGMSFRLPGGIQTREQLWDALSRRVDVVEEIPADRWRHSPLDTSEITTTQGGYLRDVDRFDPLFFTISPHEAELIDPQQRLLLELTWEAFEDAGIDPRTAGDRSRVGVFVGISSNDYLQVGKDLGHSSEAYTFTGSMANAAAGRISYVYGFNGPSVAIDTACSSSLYAVHQGSRELKHGTCDVVVAAGVNLILSPEGHLSFSRLQALSPSGRCRSFDDAADGYIRSEGAGVVVLKRLADAERDGDSVLAVISGSAVNHNGRSGGFTVPSGTAQTTVIQDAMAEAGVGVDDIAYVEAHGSATPIGDPQEINALARVFAGRSSKLRVGSVKSNLGHLEAAAGMAALGKMVVALEHGRLPGTLHFSTGNRLVDWDAVPIEVGADDVAWEPTGGRRRAGISSFGISGSNAHVIVEEYRPTSPTAVARTDPSPAVPRLLPVSANSPAALRDALSGLAAWSEGATADIADVAHTLGERRAALPHREVLVCDAVSDIPAAVEAALKSGRSAPVDHGGSGQVFVFSGQGTQYPGMARELYDHADTFRDALDEVGRQFTKAADLALLDVMFGDDDPAFRSPLYSQPMIFAVEWALARYWQALGITPAAVIGHSIGEYAAACFAGVISLENAVDLVVHRARIMEDTPKNGSMATLLCSRERAEDLLRPYPDVSIAAVNAAENITVSGLSESLDAVLKGARKQRIFVERLDVSHPFHSTQMTQGAERLYKRIRDQRFDPPTIPWISSQTGRPVTPDAMIDAAYWSRHLVEPVLFRAAVGAAVDQGMHTFVEIGAMATLGGLIAQEFRDDAVVIPSLRKGRSDLRQMADSAGRLWKLGRTVDFGGLPGRPGNLVRDLPHTPFDRQRIWYADRTGEGDSMHAGVDDAAAIRPSRTAARESIRDFLKQALNQVTGVSTDAMDESLEVFSLGVDSLMLVQLGKRVEKEFSVDIPIKTFFESLHTLGALIDFVVENRPSEVIAEVRDEPTAAVTVPPAALAIQAPTSSLETVIRSQLALMEQQLSMLAGAGASERTQAPAAAAAPAVQPAPVATRKVGTYSNNIELNDDQLTDEQSRFIADFVEKFTAKTRASKDYAAAHRETLADWIASLNFNPSLKETVYPVVSARSRGACFWDLDGNEYVDTAMGYGVHFFGHQPDFIVEAVKEQLELGYELGPQNRTAGEVAELIHDMVGAERVAFCNTGTEAVMVSIRLARAVSGRAKVARFITSFHGSYDGVLAEAEGDATVPMSIGIPQTMVDDTVVLTYGSPESLDRIRRQGHELAAVLVEPVQSRNPTLQPTEFLRQLREICTEHGIALIFDEMVVGFRLELGGAQSYFGVESDMSLYGKLVGGGMPIGIVAGKSRYLDAVDGGAWSDVDDSKPAVPTTFFAGTFCKHPLTMAASKAALSYLRDSGEEKIAELNRFTDEFVRRANDYFEAADVPLAVAHVASLYRFETVVARDMGSLSLTLNLFFKLMAYHGVYVWERRTAFFSLAHATEHQDRILEAIRVSVEALRAGGFDFRRAASVAPAHASTALSSQEKRIYVLSRMRGGNEAYQILGGLRFDGEPDQAMVDAAFRAIAHKHERLRSTYAIDGTDISVRIVPEVTPEFHVFDRTQDLTLTADDVLAVMNGPFDLETAPLWRYGIVIDPDRTHHLMVSFHHIVADGGSVEIILQDLADYLALGRLDDGGSDGYASFVRLQSEVVDLPAYEEHRQWWLNEFATVPAPLGLTTDSPYPVVNDFAGGHHYFEVDPELHRAAAAVIAEQKTTPFTFYLSLWSVLLAKATGDDDLCVGVPMDQRILGSFDATVGMFAQSLPLRIRPTSDTTVSDLIRQVRDTSFAAMDHSLYSYDALIQDLDLTRDYGRNALFDVMFTFTNARSRVRRFGDVTGTTEDVGGRRSAFAMSFELTERDGGLFGDLNFSHVYSEQRVAELMDQFRGLIAQVVKDPDATIGDLSLLDDEARDGLLAIGTGPVISDVPSLADQFGAAFATHAQRPAIRFRGAELTYDRLAERVDQYAAVLQRRGIAKGDLIGLLLPPSPDLITAMLAVNRIGGSWLPMDVKNPPKRLQSVIESAAPALVVCSDELAATLELGDRAMSISEDDLLGAAASTVVPTTAGDLAYVIFTSGSTGRPKGVMVSNGSLANFLHGMPDALRWAENSAVACLTTPSFDIYVLETLLTLVTGGTVVVAEEDDARTPASIAEFVAGNGVEYLQMTPTRLRLLFTDPDAASRALGSLRTLVVGGEAFPENLLADLRSHESLEIFNVYGPTETCIWSSVKDLTGDGPVSIGTPIANTIFYVLDDNLQLVPEGTAGNLWIGGDGVSPGYLNRPDLTAELFRADPFGDGRIYLSGDQAFWKDGEVHCLGRIDNQVKVRGYRIELEEIELAIAGHDLVAGAAAIVQDVSGGNQIIRGFYQVTAGAALDPEALKAFLAQSLADYMVPATLAEVSDIPMTMSGKVDRLALEQRTAAATDEPHRGGTGDGIDQALIAAWKKVLGAVPIGYDDSFFDLGGNSFSLILLLEELNAAFPDMLDVSDLFANPTIGKLRTHLEARLAQRSSGGAPETGVPVPVEWFATETTADGRVETALSTRTRATLERLSGGAEQETADLLHAAFALTLGKVLGRDRLTLCVVADDGLVTPVRFDLAGKTDLAEIVADYRRQLDGPDERLDLDRFVAGRHGDGTVVVACCSARQVHVSDLLRHFDVVFGAGDADRATIGIAHTRKIDPARVERLLSNYVRILGILGEPTETGDATDTPRSTADAVSERPHASKEKDQS